MHPLQVFLFENVRVVHPNRPALVKMTHSSQALLAYLLLQRHRPHPRELLASVFWGDQSQKQARRCLNTALWRLRQVLEPEEISQGTYLLTTSTGEVSFNCESNYWLDVAIFEAHSSSILAKPIQTMVAEDADMLKRALQLYTGELLEAFYDDWALFERERLRRLYLNGQAHLMHYYKCHGDFKESLLCAQKILDQDPLREEIHREMITLYRASGQRALAAQQYQICCHVLDIELGISPMEETQRLYHQILEEIPEPLSILSRSTHGLKSQEQILHHLRLSLDGFDRAVRQLRRAIRLIEEPTER
jgi:DNA-binding SARP family transcriptional activator